MEQTRTNQQPTAAAEGLPPQGEEQQSHPEAAYEVGLYLLHESGMDSRDVPVLEAVAAFHAIARLLRNRLKRGYGVLRLVVTEELVDKTLNGLTSLKLLRQKRALSWLDLTIGIKRTLRELQVLQGADWREKTRLRLPLKVWLRFPAKKFAEDSHQSLETVASGALGRDSRDDAVILKGVNLKSRLKRASAQIRQEPAIPPECVRVFADAVKFMKQATSAVRAQPWKRPPALAKLNDPQRIECAKMAQQFQAYMVGKRNPPRRAKKVTTFRELANQMTHDPKFAHPLEWNAIFERSLAKCLEAGGIDLKVLASFLLPYIKPGSFPPELLAPASGLPAVKA